MRIFQTLEEVAIKSNVGWARLASAVVAKNRIISIGTNSYKSHPFQKKWATNKDAIFLHAETSAIHSALKILDTYDLSDCELYVCRMKRPSQHSTEFVYGMSKPCNGCSRAIAEFGISNVYYTTDEDKVIEWL
ncbi:MAG TPA: deaminase [Candidatus Nitrosopolaris rasttigaisensis]|nr:deaminase [Candidatus Nitrosopolaris rasttigaisensis]